MLCMYAIHYQTIWVIGLPLVTFEYNCSMQQSTCYSPMIELFATLSISVALRPRALYFIS